MKKQRVWVLVLVLLAIVVLESPAQRRESGHWQEKALHLAIFFPSNGNFDPIKSSYISLQPLYRAIYATLCKLDPELRAYSSLAESIEQSGSTFSVQLRKEAAFSDGSDITAMNVIGSIEHCLSSLQHSTPLWQMIEGAEDFVNGKSAFCSGLKIVNPKRVEIQLKGKNPQFAHYLTSTLLAIQPTHRNQNQNKNAFSGPFAISAIHNKGKEVIVTLKRNPYYFGRKSKVDVLYFHFYPYRVDFDHAISSGQMDLFLYNDYFKIPFSKYRYNYFKRAFDGI